MKLLFVICVVIISIHCCVAEFQCSNDTKYIENGCNECSCSPSLGIVCSSAKKIVDCQNYHKLRHCKIGSSKKQDACNMCYCVEDIGTVCSVKKCA